MLVVLPPDWTCINLATSSGTFSSSKPQTSSGTGPVHHWLRSSSGTCLNRLDSCHLPYQHVHTCTHILFCTHLCSYSTRWESWLPKKRAQIPACDPYWCSRLLVPAPLQTRQTQTKRERRAGSGCTAHIWASCIYRVNSRVMRSLWLIVSPSEEPHVLSPSSTLVGDADEHFQTSNLRLPRPQFTKSACSSKAEVIALFLGQKLQLIIRFVWDSVVMDRLQTRQIRRRIRASSKCCWRRRPHVCGSRTGPQPMCVHEVIFRGGGDWATPLS